MREKMACFTGHRKIPPEKLKGISWRLKATLIQLIEDAYLYFSAGGALGFDTLAAQAVSDLKQQYPQIKLILVLPCLSQANSWSEKDMQMYEYIKEQADKIVYTVEGNSGDSVRVNQYAVGHYEILGYEVVQY